jgi:hypothetical protein
MSDNFEMHPGLFKECEAAFKESLRSNLYKTGVSLSRIGDSVEAADAGGWFAYYDVRTVEDAELVGRIVSEFQEETRKRILESVGIYVLAFSFPLPRPGQDASHFPQRQYMTVRAKSREIAFEHGQQLAKWYGIELMEIRKA